MGRLDNKVALITGAARGQGAAEARRFVEEGAQVVLTDILDEDGEKLAAELGDRAVYLHLDVTDEEEWATTVGLAWGRFGRLDVLINNAGLVRFAPILQMSLATYRTVIDVNQIGVFLGMREVIPKMMESGGGAIVNISSVDGLCGTPGFSAYSSVKHAVVGLTKSAALETVSLGIRINAVHPGGVDTPMLDGADVKDFNLRAVLPTKVPMARLAQPEEIAALVCWLASDESSYCTGSTFVVDGGLLAGVTAD